MKITIGWKTYTVPLPRKSRRICRLCLEPMSILNRAWLSSEQVVHHEFICTHKNGSQVIKHLHTAIDKKGRLIE